MATNNEIVKVIHKLGVAFGKPIDDELLEIYASTLDDLPGSTLEAAAVRWIKQGGKWFPKVYELRQIAQTEKNSKYLPDTDIFWGAMKAINANERGLLSNKDLEADKYYQWYQRTQAKHPANCPCRICSGEMIEDEAWQLALEQTEEWMVEDVPMLV